MVLNQDPNEVRFSRENPTTGISLPESRTQFIFFHLPPKGACDHCNGLGTVNEINPKKIIPNPKLSIKAGFAPLGGR
jgi:excinuclease ABC subunit A